MTIEIKTTRQVSETRQLELPAYLQDGNYYYKITESGAMMVAELPTLGTYRIETCSPQLAAADGKDIEPAVFYEAFARVHAKLQAISQVELHTLQMDADLLREATADFDFKTALQDEED